MFTRIGALIIGLALILQPMAGIPAAQAARSEQDSMPAGPTSLLELDQPPEEQRNDDTQPFTGALSRAPDTAPNAEVEAVLASAMQVAAGRYHTCALTTVGGVKCWGGNSSGQLGDGTTTNRLAPVNVSGLSSGAVAIAAGTMHTCGVTGDGRVKCWGANDYGQLGAGYTSTSRRTPIEVGGLGSRVVAVAASWRHTCALTATGGVKCWGDNSSGGLGDGTTTNRLTPVDVSGLGSRAEAIAAGAGHNCAVMAGGGLKCWGSNYAGQLGDGTTTRRLTPVDVVGLGSGVAAAVTGWSHTCALTPAGGVKCWGDNFRGELGDGTTMDRSTPGDVSGLSNGVTAIAAGETHTCAAAVGGEVKCWGSNMFGQLGDGYVSEDRLLPVDVRGLSSGVVALAAGWKHTCVQTATGGVKCWGSNSSGQLGDGTGALRYTPADVVGLGSRAEAIAAGAGHNCAVMAGGGLKCWGSNYAGQLGDGTRAYRYTPDDVVGLGSGVKAVAAGGSHTCALTPAGGVKCWGANDYGQLGDGTKTDRLTPVAVVGSGNGVAAVAAGGSHTCAVTTADGVKCWGKNDSGQLGDGTRTSRYTPVDVVGLGSGVMTVVADGSHTCALMTGGGVKCWGNNFQGQLGDGTRTSRYTPVDVMGLGSGVTAVVAGGSHTCALTTKGGVKCWGANDYGQLGDGTAIGGLTPVAVVGLANGAAAVAAGGSHACVLMMTGGVKCWGANGSGQLAVNPGWTPVDVVEFGGLMVSSVSGQITYRDHSPIADVFVSDGAGHTDTTDASGNYTLTGLPGGTYTLSAAKNGYKFKQSFTGGVTVPPDAKYKDFTGWKTCDPPGEPFLDLPLAYDRTNAVYNFVRELQNHNLGGVQSWFDHNYPTYTYRDYGVQPTGIQLYYHTQGPLDQDMTPADTLRCYGPRAERLCYDGHNGIDLVNRPPYTTGSTTIRAAAGGEVVAVCREAKTGCETNYPSPHVTTYEPGYGNYVVIDHGNGYYTRYGHLLTENLAELGPVYGPGGAPIGTMGNSGWSTGTHLHFAVHCDDGNGQWDNELIDQPVDPFGWSGGLRTPSVTDPWAIKGGPVSARLWIYAEELYCSISASQPSVCVDPTVKIHAQVPPGTFPPGTQLVVSRAPASTPSTQWLSSGDSFSLRTSSQTESSAPTVSSGSTALPQPIALQVTWDAAATRHLNMNQTLLYARSEESEAWYTLATTADQGGRTAQAQTTELGDFDLRAPLLCPDGDMEPNDDYSQAWATASETAPVSGAFDISADEDWYRVDMNAGRGYTLQTSALGASVDTILELYDTDGVTRLASDDNGGGGGTASRLEWIPGHSGTYLVKVARTTGGAFGCTTSYTLGISSVAVGGQSLYLPIVVR